MFPLSQGSRLLLVVMAVVLFPMLPGNSVSAYAQGCAACRDATAGSAPRAREGLRRAILVMGISAGGLCVGVFLVARRIEQNREARLQL